MKPRVIAVIPARLNSSRFPRKVLHQYQGRPLLYYVYREVSRAKLIDKVIVATDSPLVAKEVEAFSGECYLTSKRHRTGSDRVAETARGVGGNIIVNVQADNFGLSGAVLDRAIARFKRDRTAEIATLARRINDDDDLFNPDIVKLLTDKNNWALIFSRFPVPYVRDIKETGRCRQYRFLEHIGVYFFRRPALARFARCFTVGVDHFSATTW